MNPEVLKELLTKNHPSVNLNSSDMQLVFHYLKAYHKELQDVVKYEKEKACRYCEKKGKCVI